MILKNYYDYENMVVENYLEFNNLLNYLVLNNDFINTIEDPYNEVGRNSNEEEEDAATTSVDEMKWYILIPDNSRFYQNIGFNFV